MRWRRDVMAMRRRCDGDRNATQKSPPDSHRFAVGIRGAFLRLDGWLACRASEGIVQNREAPRVPNVLRWESGGLFLRLDQGTIIIFNPQVAVRVGVRGRVGALYECVSC